MTKRGADGHASLISRDPEIVFGKLAVKGTRISVEFMPFPQSPSRAQRQGVAREVVPGAKRKREVVERRGAVRRLIPERFSTPLNSAPNQCAPSRPRPVLPTKISTVP